MPVSIFYPSFISPSGGKIELIPWLKVSLFQLKPLSVVKMPLPLITSERAFKSFDVRSVPLKAHLIFSTGIHQVNAVPQAKPSKDIFTDSLTQKGIQSSRVNVTRRPAEHYLKAQMNLSGIWKRLPLRHFRLCQLGRSFR